MTSQKTLTWAPLLPLRALFYKGESRVPEVLSDRSVRFYFSGSHALWNGLQALKLPRGTQILFPAFHCGAELDSALKAGFRADFYRIDSRLRIDLDAVRRMLNPQTRALFLIHFFGFSQPIESVKEFCRVHDLLLVEDCAHALYSSDGNRPLGTTGDLAVFSLRKFLPVPEGGAFRLADRFAPPEEAPPPPRGETLRGLKHETERSVRMRGSAPAGLALDVAKGALLPLSSLKGRRRSLPQCLDASIYFDVGRGGWGISALSKRLLGRIDHRRIVQKRRENFSFLLNALSGRGTAEPLFDVLPEGICPWMFPLTAPNVSSLIAHLREGGIEAEPFWREIHPVFPLERFPEIKELKARLIGLPVHQDLGESELSFLAERIKTWRG